jgi:hypothetical protein
VIRNAIENRPVAASVGASVGPVAALALLGTVFAALGMKWATFAAGAPTPVLVVLAPVVVLLARRGANRRQAVLIATAALAVNLATEAVATTAQVALLHL